MFSLYYLQNVQFDSFIHFEMEGKEYLEKYKSVRTLSAHIFQSSLYQVVHSWREKLNCYANRCDNAIVIYLIDFYMQFSVVDSLLCFNEF